ESSGAKDRFKMAVLTATLIQKCTQTDSIISNFNFTDFGWRLLQYNRPFSDLPRCPLHARSWGRSRLGMLVALLLARREARRGPLGRALRQTKIFLWLQLQNEGGICRNRRY